MDKKEDKKELNGIPKLSSSKMLDHYKKIMRQILGDNDPDDYSSSNIVTMDSSLPVEEVIIRSYYKEYYSNEFSYFLEAYMVAAGLEGLELILYALKEDKANTQDSKKKIKQILLKSSSPTKFVTTYKDPHQKKYKRYVLKGVNKDWRVRPLRTFKKLLELKIFEDAKKQGTARTNRKLLFNLPKFAYPLDANRKYWPEEVFIKTLEDFLYAGKVKVEITQHPTINFDEELKKLKEALKKQTQIDY